MESENLFFDENNIPSRLIGDDRMRSSFEGFRAIITRRYEPPVSCLDLLSTI